MAARTHILRRLSDTKLRMIAQTRVQGRTTRAELAQLFSLTPSSVSQSVKELVDLGILIETDRVRNGRGQPTIFLEMNPSFCHSAGVSIQNDELGFCMIDARGEPIAKEKIHGLFRDPMETCEIIHEKLMQLLQAANIEQDNLIGIGIAMTGIFEKDGEEIWTPQEMDKWRGFNLYQQLKKYFEVYVEIENDGTAAALGEYLGGIGKKYRSFFYLFLGYGIGGGLIYNGHRFRGCYGNGAQIGAMIPLAPTVRASLTSLAQVLGREHGSIKLEEINEMVRKGDPVFLQFVNEAAMNLVAPLRAVAELMDPEAVVIAGKFPKSALDLFASRIQLGNPLSEPSKRVPRPKILVSDTNFSIAPEYGAAHLPFHNIFSKFST